MLVFLSDWRQTPTLSFSLNKVTHLLHQWSLWSLSLSLFSLLHSRTWGVLGTFICFFFIKLTLKCHLITVAFSFTLVTVTIYNIILMPLCCGSSLSCVRLCVTPWTVACQDRLSVGILQASILDTRVGCHVLLQGIFPTLASNPGLPHCRQILYRLCQGSPRILERVGCPFSRASS